MGDMDKGAPTPVYVIGFGLAGLLATGVSGNWTLFSIIFMIAFLYVSIWCIGSIVRHDGKWIYWSTDNWFQPNPKAAEIEARIAALEHWHQRNPVEKISVDGYIDDGGRPRGMLSKEDWAEAGRQLMTKNTGKPVRC